MVTFGRFLVLPLTSLCVVVPASLAASAASERHCYPNPGHFAHDVYVQHISCRAAGRAIDRGHDEGRRYVIHGYRCRTVRATSFESTEYRCVQRRAVIRFQLGG